MCSGLSINAPSVDLGIRAGFLGAGVEGGSYHLDAQVTIEFGGQDEDRRITLAELWKEPPTASAIVTPTGLLDVHLPLQARLGGRELFTEEALPSIVIQDGRWMPGLGGVGHGADGDEPIDDDEHNPDYGDLFDTTPPDFRTENFDELFNFNNMDAGTFVGLLEQITSWLGEFGKSDVFALDIPLVGDALRGVLQLSDVFHDNLLIDDLDNNNSADDVPKLLDQSNQTSFVRGTNRRWATVQEFDEKLTEILGPGSPVTYDAARESLLVNLALDEAFGSLDAPLDFNFGFGPLGDLSSEGKLHLSAEGQLGMTLGIYLGDEGGVELTNDTTLSFSEWWRFREKTQPRLNRSRTP